MRYSSKSRISVLIAALALVFAVFAIAGCGDEDKPASDASTAAETATDGGASATGESGSDGAEADDGGVSPQGDDGGEEGGAGDEEPARAPIAITVEDGKFSDKTSDEVHVPTYMAIELDVTVKGSDDATLTIVRPGGKKITRTFPGGKRTTYLTEGLRPGKALVVSMEDSQVLVIADLVPGP